MQAGFVFEINHLNIEKFKRMNIIALKRITAFSSLGVAAHSF